MSKAVNPRVAALIYGDGSQPADSKLRSQIDSQEISPTAILVISSRPGDSAFAKDVEAALAGLPSDVTWIWLLDSNVEVAENSLALLLQRAEVSPSAALIGAKQLRQRDRSNLSSMGISISQLAEPVRLRSGEFDQGQHDGDSDVLAVATDCSLVLREILQREVQAMSPSPAGAFGYEFGMRLRAGGYRVLVEPRAESWVTERSNPTTFAGQFEQLTTRIHLGALTMPVPALVVYLVLTPLLLPISMGSALLRKLPAQALAAPAAIVWGWLTIATRLRARASFRALGDISAQRDFWLNRSELRRLRTINRASESVAAESRIRLFESGIAWWLLIPFLASYQLFSLGVPRNLQLPPLSGSLSELIRTTFSEQRPYWDGVNLPAEPSSWLWLTLGLASPSQPGVAVSWLLFLAPTLSFLLAARLLSEVAKQRTLLVLLALGYALNPLLIFAALSANAALVSVLLLLPVCALALRRAWMQSREQSWGWWATFGLTAFLSAAIYPLLFSFFAFVIVIATIFRQPSKLPAAVLAATPAFLLALAHGVNQVVNGSAILLPQATTPILIPSQIWWLIPLGVIFLVWGAGIKTFQLNDYLTMLFLGSAAFAWIWVAPLSLPLLSAALLSALLSLAARTATAGEPAESSLRGRLSVRLTSAALVLASSFGTLILASQPVQFEQGDSNLMPALVSATAQLDPAVRTLVIDGDNAGFGAELVWNDGRHLDEVSPLIEFNAPQLGTDTKQRTAKLVAGLVAGNSAVVSPELAALEIGYILVTDPSPELNRALATIDGLASSGETEFGELWRNTRYQTSTGVAPAPSPVQWVILGLLAALVLLAIPKPRFGSRSGSATPIFDEAID